MVNSTNIDGGNAGPNSTTVSTEQAVMAPATAQANSAIGFSKTTLVGATPQWVHVAPALSYSFFAVGTTTFSAQLMLLPPSGIIHGVKIQHSASFTGGAISAYTISVGDVNTVDLYASAFNVHQAYGPTVYQLSSNFAGESLASATQLYVTATSTSANLNAATSGVVDIFALLSVAS